MTLSVGSLLNSVKRDPRERPEDRESAERFGPFYLLVLPIDIIQAKVLHPGHSSLSQPPTFFGTSEAGLSALVPLEAPATAANVS